MPRARTSKGIKGHNDKVYSTYLAVNAAVMLRRSASRTARCGATRRRIRTEDGHQPPCAHTARLSNPLLLAGGLRPVVGRTWSASDIVALADVKVTRSASRFFYLATVLQQAVRLACLGVSLQLTAVLRRIIHYSLKSED